MSSSKNDRDSNANESDITHRQHFGPQMLYKYFKYDEKNVLIYDKCEQLTKLLQPISILYEEFYYCYDSPQKPEKELAKIEAKMDRLLSNKLQTNNKYNIEIEDKEIIISFLMTLYLRTKRTRRQFLNQLNIFRIFCFKQHPNINAIIEFPFNKNDIKELEEYTDSDYQNEQDDFERIFKLDIIKKIVPISKLNQTQPISSYQSLYHYLFCITYSIYSKVNAEIYFNKFHTYFEKYNNEFVQNFKLDEQQLKMLNFFTLIKKNFKIFDFNKILSQDQFLYCLCILWQRFYLNGKQPKILHSMGINGKIFTKGEIIKHHQKNYEKWLNQSRKKRNHVPPIETF